MRDMTTFSLHFDTCCAALTSGRHLESEKKHLTNKLSMASRREGKPKAKRPRLQKSGSVSSDHGTGISKSFKAVSELDRLKYALKNTPNDVIIRKIRQSVDASEKRVPNLSTIFDKQLFPPPAKELSMCARCYEDFDPNYNTKKSCITKHDEYWRYCGKRYLRHGDKRYCWRCEKCNKKWETSSSDGYHSDEIDSICYMGRHAVDLDIEGENSKSNQYVVTSSESSSSMDSDDISDGETSEFW